MSNDATRGKETSHDRAAQPDDLALPAQWQFVNDHDHTHGRTTFLVHEDGTKLVVQTCAPAHQPHSYVNVRDIAELVVVHPDGAEDRLVGPGSPEGQRAEALRAARSHPYAEFGEVLGR